MKTKISVALGCAVALTAGLALWAPNGQAAEREWFNKKTGEIIVELMPERIQISTDLYDVGYGWLESRNFREPLNNGPFLVFEFEDSKEPDYWYYKGMDIVPIGTKFLESDTTGTVADAEDEE